MELDVQNILKDRNYCPCILLGKYTVEFRKQYNDKIFMVSSLEAVRNLVENYIGIRDLEGRYLVLDGIGFLSDTGQSSLLKFIEESKLPMVLLSYYDRVSPIILSRMKFIFKKPEYEVKNLKFLRIGDCLNNIDEKKKNDKEFSETDELKYLVEYCPTAFQLLNSLPTKNYTNRRILKIIGKL